MVAKLLGNDYMLWIESATPGTYTLIKGQSNCSIDRSTAKIDTTSKDDGRYGTSAPGNREVGVGLDIMPKLPDALGYTRLETFANTDPAAPVNIQIRKGGTAGLTADAVFQCLMYPTLEATNFDQGAVVKTKATFFPAAAPTIDALA